MYFGDKIALDNLQNHSICVRTDNGIRNINNEQDIIVENLVYVENIDTIKSKIMIIQNGTMVRYKPIIITLR